VAPTWYSVIVDLAVALDQKRDIETYGVEYGNDLDRRVARQIGVAKAK
jgi:hypothetical protein